MLLLVGLPLDWLRTHVPVEIKEYYWMASAIYTSPWFWGFTLSILLLEWIRPAVRAQSPLSWGLAQDFLWFNLDVVFKLALLPLVVGLLKLLYDGVTGGYTIGVLADLHPALAIGIAVLVFDFLQWFHHWVRHKVKAFWHFHAIHHSQQELNLFTDFRVHWGEYAISEALVFVPMFALGLAPFAVMGVASIRWWYTRFIHANIRTNLGPLKYVLVTPQFHRVHHSIEPEHQDKNFGVVFSVWDRIFGTLYPNYEVYPATGVVGLDFPPPRRMAPTAWAGNYLRMFLHPFRAIARGAKRDID